MHFNFLSSLPSYTLTFFKTFAISRLLQYDLVLYFGERREHKLYCVIILIKMEPELSIGRLGIMF
jgi:hypothetical protein